jgi:DNA-binding CsgD family transcriptional regulator
MDRKTNRSSKYQDFFAELPYSNEMMAEFQENQGLNDYYTSEDKDILSELRDKLAVEFWRVVDETLTVRQAQVLKLLAKGYTQIEIAKQLNVNQSSITKSVNGNCDYRNNKAGDSNVASVLKVGNVKTKRSYGGSRKKLRKLCSMDEKIIEITEQIADIHTKYSVY